MVDIDSIFKSLHLADLKRIVGDNSGKKIMERTLFRVPSKRNRWFGSF